MALERSSFPPPEEWLSFHATGGIAAISAVVQHRLGDPNGRDRALDRYRRIAAAAADPHYPTEDLLWGRGGFLYGAAYLRSQLGDDAITDDHVTPVLDAMIATGRSLARAHADDLRAGPHGRSPLVYVNLNREVFVFFARAFVGSRAGLARGVAALGARAVTFAGDRRYDLAHRYDAGLVHGLSGAAYLLMHFPSLWRQGWMEDVRTALDCLMDGIDAERGALELLPSQSSDAYHARTRTDPYNERVHWCNGSPAMTFLFARAYEVFRDERYLSAARRAADHVWRYGLLRKGNGICHGIAGNGYAFLALHRATGDERDLDRALHFAAHTWDDPVNRLQRAPDRPWSLYEGAMGTLCFYQDCLDPQRARFPAFEI